jgi:kojibiose phosphorylase
MMAVCKESLDGAREERWGSQYFLGNGRMGLRAHHEDIPNSPATGFYVAGTYTYAPRELVPLHAPEHILVHPQRLEEYQDGTKDPDLHTLPNLPNPFTINIAIDGSTINPGEQPHRACERALDMEEARLNRRLVFLDHQKRTCVVDSERWVSWDDTRLLGWRYTIKCTDEPADIKVTPCFNTSVTNVQGIRLFSVEEESTQSDAAYVKVRTTDGQHEIGMAMAWNETQVDGKTTVEAIVAVTTEAADDPRELAASNLRRGYEQVRDEHKKAVAAALHDHTMKIGSDPLTAEGMQHGQLHLEMALCPDNPNVSVPIKGLTGEGYRFMVFWDTDFHMFPYFLYTRPEQARNLLMYRYNLLDAARENARQWGYKGAQVPWETAISGKEETAPWLNLQDRELHISADTAYAVMLYDRATLDSAFLEDFGAEIVFETARFFASRSTWIEENQRYEMLDIGCPDQYHTWADNNVFISMMARWNLQYAVSLAEDPRTEKAQAKISLGQEEIKALRHTAENLHVIEPNDEGLIEEFDGFFDLSPDLRGITEKHCSHSKAVKQPDVVAMFHLFGDHYPQEILQKNWRYYTERTLHGSSLSLPGTALAASVSGLIEESIPYFQKGSRLDLDDVNGNTSIGIHVSAYAVLWETAVFGYLGCRFEEKGVVLNPTLPASWSHIAAPICWKGQRIRIFSDHKRTTVKSCCQNTNTISIARKGQDFMQLQPGEEIELS